MWAVLYDPTKRGNRWEPHEFFATGRAEFEETLAYLAELGVEVRFGRALDFGCGVGRLTQPLASTFERVDGVDIAPSMIEHARRHDPPSNCVFHLNERDDLSLFEDDTFDLVHSRLVLQHMRPALARGYLREFMRVLVPGGIAVFDLPSRPADSLQASVARRVPPPVLNLLRRVRYRSGAMEQHWIAPDEVTRVLEAAGGRVVDSAPIPAARGALITQQRYCVLRADDAA
jgi:SAM-dependent methyltransferase